MKKKKKTSPQKEKALQKTERESFRFQMKWEAKKLYPEHTDELSARVEAECAIIEDANLLPDLQAGADFLQKFRMQFGDFARMTYSSFLKNSIVAQCIGLTPACAEGESALPIFTQDMLSEPLQINILLDLSVWSDAGKWMKKNLDVLNKTPEGFEVKKGVLTFFFPVLSQLQAFAFAKAQALQKEMDDTAKQCLEQEIKAYFEQDEPDELYVLKDFDTFGKFLQQYRATFATASEQYSSTLNKSLLAYYFGIIPTIPVQDQADKGKKKGTNNKASRAKKEDQTLEITVATQAQDCDALLAMLKGHFPTLVKGDANGWLIQLNRLRLRIPLEDVFCASVKSGAKSLYVTMDDALGQRLEAELDWYGHYGIMGDMLLLRDFVTCIDARFDASPSTATGLLKHSVAALCLGLCQDFPDITNANDLAFFQQKNYFVRMVSVHFDSVPYESVVHEAEACFGSTEQISEEATLFKIGKLSLRICKTVQEEQPEGVDWYRMGTIRKMFDWYSKYEY